MYQYMDPMGNGMSSFSDIVTDSQLEVEQANYLNAKVHMCPNSRLDVKIWQKQMVYTPKI